MQNAVASKSLVTAQLIVNDSLRPARQNQRINERIAMPNEYDVSTQVTLAVTIKTNRKLRVTDFEEIIQEMALRTWEAVLDEDDGTRVAVELQDFGTDGVTIKPHAPGTIAPFEHC